VDIAHTDIVREAIGQPKADVLSDVFKNCLGSPPSVPAARYRAAHVSWLDILDELVSDRSFLQPDDTHRNYRLRVYALPLIDDPRAKSLLELMGLIYKRFKILYDEYLSEQIPLSKVLESVVADRKDSLEALFYIVDAHGVWSGLSIGFPYGDSPTIGIAESVLRKEDFGSVLSEFYQWHFVNPKKRAGSWENQPPQLNIEERLSFFANSPDGALPDWYRQLDDIKKALVIEIDAAVVHGLEALPTMGLRTLLESVMRDRVGEKSNFRETLAAFREAGWVTDQHAQVIEQVIDVGHASAHRAYFPDPPELKICIDVVKHLIEGIYVLKPKMDTVAKKTPKRMPPNNSEKH
jgi:hypothetical protein